MKRTPTPRTARTRLSPTQLRDIRFELDREQRRFTGGDARRDVVIAAMRRLREGTYGSCTQCGGVIPWARLSVMPETPHCITCAVR